MTTIERIEELRRVAKAFSTHPSDAALMTAAASELEVLQKEVAKLKAENTSMRDREKIEPNYCFACGGTGGHQEGCLGITGLALAQSERDSLRSQNQKLREVLQDQKERWQNLPADPIYYKAHAIYAIDQALATQPEKMK